MMGNVVAKQDANGNVFPRKESNAKKIDGAVALLMGVSRVLALTSTAQAATLSKHLEEHGIRRL